MDELTSSLSNLGINPSLPHYPGANPLVNPIDIYRSYLTEILVHLTEADANRIYPALQRPKTVDKGDLVLAVPQLRIQNAKPADLATSLVEKVPRSPSPKPQDLRAGTADPYPQFPPHPLFLRPDADGITLRFSFAPRLLPSIVLPCIFTLGAAYGSNPSHGLHDPADPSTGRNKIVVEFSSPNLAREFQAAHLRSTVLGGFLSHLFAGAGWDVVRTNYLGDWGRQYGILAVAWRMFGSEEALQADPIGHLFDIYVRVSALVKPEEDEFTAARKEGKDTTALEATGLLGEARSYSRRMEVGDAELLSLWRHFRALSIERYEATYARLNVFFDEYAGESQVKPESMAKAEAVLQEKGVSEVDRGATILDFKKHGAPKLGVAIIRNNNGTTNYLLRDVGAAIERWDKYAFDRMLYVVPSEHNIHLQRLFKILELMGYGAARSRMEHVSFGKVQGMSNRRGNVKSLDDILEDCGTAMHEVMRRSEAKYNMVEKSEEMADTLSIAAITVQDLSGKRTNNYAFDLERMASFEGDTGPSLQYAHARLRSIVAKTPWNTEQLHAADLALLTEPHAVNLVRLMAQYPDVVGQTLKTLEPATMLTYLFRLTHQLSSSYDVLRVDGAKEGEEVSRARAALYEAARQVIGNGMRVLGLTPVDRM